MKRFFGREEERCSEDPSDSLPSLSPPALPLALHAPRPRFFPEDTLVVEILQRASPLCLRPVQRPLLQPDGVLLVHFLVKARGRLAGFLALRFLDYSNLMVPLSRYDMYWNVFRFRARGEAGLGFPTEECRGRSPACACLPVGGSGYICKATMDGAAHNKRTAAMLSYAFLD